MNMAFSVLRFSLTHNAGVTPPYPALEAAYSSDITGRAAAPVGVAAVNASSPTSYNGEIHLAGAFEYRIHGTEAGYYIPFESGFQMISDSTRQFDQNPDCHDFIFSMPVIWDETHALAAEAGQYAVVARHHGDKWWIGGITNNAEKTRGFDLRLDFLPKRKTYRLNLFEDESNADQQAMDYNVRQQDVKHGDIVHVKMARNGGMAARIE